MVCWETFCTHTRPGSAFLAFQASWPIRIQLDHCLNQSKNSTPIIRPLFSSADKRLNLIGFFRLFPLGRHHRNALPSTTLRAKGCIHLKLRAPPPTTVPHRGNQRPEMTNARPSTKKTSWSHAQAATKTTPPRSTWPHRPHPPRGGHVGLSTSLHTSRTKRPSRVWYKGRKSNGSLFDETISTRRPAHQS